jgi:hypothetical protein
VLSELHRQTPPMPICPSTLDDGIRLGSWGSPLRTSLPISPEVPIGLFEMRSLGTMLPPLLPSLGVEAVVEHSCPACDKRPVPPSSRFSSDHTKQRKVI